MKTFKYLLMATCLCFQTTVCLARSENIINLTVSPDPFTHCNQYGVDVAITENSTLGISPANCINRPTFGLMDSQVSSKFKRILVWWRYSPYGVLNDGYFFDVGVGAESNEFRTTAGSTANVSFIDTGGHGGYQWFWDNGLNISALLGVGHLMRDSLDQSISPAESISVKDYLSQQTSVTTHIGFGVIFGWAF